MRLLALHGFLGDPADFDPLAAELRALDAGLPALEALRLPGHGARPEEVPASWPQWLDGLERRLPAGPFVLLGYSLGARLALHLALRQPAQLKALCLLAGDPGIEDAQALAARRSWDAGWARRLREEPLESVLADWYRQPLFAPLRKKLGLEALVSRRCGQRGEALARVMEVLGAGNTPASWSRLQELSLPVLYLAGSEDPKYAAIARRLQQEHPAWRVAVLPACGHALQLEAPREVAERLQAFLHDHEQQL